MLNRAIIMGRLTRDPELRHTPSNTPVVSFTVAVDRGRKTEGQPTADFIDCVAWNRQAEFVQQWFNKGAMIIVSGRIQTRNWEDRNGNKRVSVEIVADEINFGETKRSRDSYQQQNGYQQGGYGAPRNDGYSAPAQSYSAPVPSYDLPSDDSDFSELSDDDGEVPF